MTYKENITAILECYFARFKKEIIDSACNRILEQEPFMNKPCVANQVCTKREMAETYYDAIRNFSMDEMARFLREMNNTDMIPKRWRCNSESCFRCNDDLICFREWLKQEVKIVETKHNDH